MTITESFRSAKYGRLTVKQTEQDCEFLTVINIIVNNRITVAEATMIVNKLMPAGSEHSHVVNFMHTAKGNTRFSVMS